MRSIDEAVSEIPLVDLILVSSACFQHLREKFSAPKEPLCLLRSVRIESSPLVPRNKAVFQKWNRNSRMYDIVRVEDIRF